MRDFLNFNNLIVSFLLLLLFSLFSFAYSASHHPEVFLDSIKDSKNQGRQIVIHFCITCHDIKPLISLGAPRINQLSDWEPRVANGFNKLLQHTLEGIHAMPPRGGCFECTDEQLILAILAMIPTPLKNNLNKN